MRTHAHAHAHAHTHTHTPTPTPAQTNTPNNPRRRWEEPRYFACGGTNLGFREGIACPHCGGAHCGAQALPAPWRPSHTGTSTGMRHVQPLPQDRELRRVRTTASDAGNVTQGPGGVPDPQVLPVGGAQRSQTFRLFRGKEGWLGPWPAGRAVQSAKPGTPSTPHGAPPPPFPHSTERTRVID